MGGLGAILYAKQQPQDIDAVVLIAPFLSDEGVLKEIEAAGGLARWVPKEPIPESDYQRDLWKWLRGYTDPQHVLPPIYLGFGTEDRFVRGHRLLATALPKTQVFSAPGTHAWEPWREVFHQILATGVVSSRR